MSWRPTSLLSVLTQLFMPSFHGNMKSRTYLSYILSPSIWRLTFSCSFVTTINTFVSLRGLRTVIQSSINIKTGDIKKHRGVIYHIMGQPAHTHNMQQLALCYCRYLISQYSVILAVFVCKASARQPGFVCWRWGLIIQRLLGLNFNYEKVLIHLHVGVFLQCWLKFIQPVLLWVLRHLAALLHQSDKLLSLSGVPTFLIPPETKTELTMILLKFQKVDLCSSVSEHSNLKTSIHVFCTCSVFR